MTLFYCGLDVSKGYVDACLTNGEGVILHQEQYDDTPEGHAKLITMLSALITHHPDATVFSGIEATGGLERNWVNTLSEQSSSLTLKTKTLNPLAVNRFLSQQLHRTVTDQHSAHGIARYIRLTEDKSVPQLPKDLEEGRTLYHVVCSGIKRVAMMKTELQSLLPFVAPELVHYCRKGVPNWILALLAKYPTPPKLARAHAETVARIPSITRTKAQALIAAAAQSVAAQTGPAIEQAVLLLVAQLQKQMNVVEAMRTTLIAQYRTHPVVLILVTIPGIGFWTAVSLLLELGMIERFPNAEALVAYGGLDPVWKQSGDRLRTGSISKRGNRRLRKMLFLPARAAVRSAGPLQEFYQRLIAKGKPQRVAQVAVMRRLLRIVYACWISNTSYEPRRVERTDNQKPIAQSTSKQNRARTQSKRISIAAPVSWKEARKRSEYIRRKDEALPQSTQ